MKAKCVRNAGYNLTHCAYYEVLSQDQNVNKVEIKDDNGYRIWVAADCFMF